ncbi:hypothetical protein PGTUg99_019120 [Puccinia graminis f. sp. tritici]|uniref:Uncharacterized protein n=1 Tax=Puccinia graminis f. sp. tritici TaxID=56615 RepID=A0A5B0S563_PUCGR|nr:hypothetical protein PGTUg99_019120 [Puccinia graminis f. sp. tritici]
MTACNASMKGSSHDPIDLVSDVSDWSTVPQSSHLRQSMTTLPLISNIERPPTTGNQENAVHTVPRQTGYETTDSLVHVPNVNTGIEFIPIDQTPSREIDFLSMLDARDSRDHRGFRGSSSNYPSPSSNWEGQGLIDPHAETRSGPIIDYQHLDNYGQIPSNEWTNSNRPWSRQSDRRADDGTLDLINKVGKRSPSTEASTSSDRPWSNPGLSHQRRALGRDWIPTSSGRVPTRLYDGDQYPSTFGSQLQEPVYKKTKFNEPSVEIQSTIQEPELETKDFLNKIGQASGNSVQVFHNLDTPETVDLISTIGKDSRTGTSDTDHVTKRNEDTSQQERLHGAMDFSGQVNDHKHPSTNAGPSHFEKLEFDANIFAIENPSPEDKIKIDEIQKLAKSSPNKRLLIDGFEWRDVFLTFRKYYLLPRDKLQDEVPGGGIVVQVDEYDPNQLSRKSVLNSSILEITNNQNLWVEFWEKRNTQGVKIFNTEMTHVERALLVSLFYIDMIDTIMPPIDRIGSEYEHKSEMLQGVIEMFEDFKSSSEYVHLNSPTGDNNLIDQKYRVVQSTMSQLICLHD